MIKQNIYSDKLSASKMPKKILNHLQITSLESPCYKMRHLSSFQKQILNLLAYIRGWKFIRLCFLWNTFVFASTFLVTAPFKSVIFSPLIWILDSDYPWNLHVTIFNIILQSILFHMHYHSYLRSPPSVIRRSIQEFSWLTINNIFFSIDFT